MKKTAKKTKLKKLLVKWGVQDAVKPLATAEKNISDLSETIKDKKRNEKRLNEIAGTLSKISGLLSSSKELTYKELSKLFKQLEDTQKEFSKLNTERVKDISIVKSDLQETKKNIPKLEETIAQEIKKLRLDFQKLQTMGGGSMNRQILFNGADSLTRYTDINFIGSGVTITANNNDTKKRVDVTLTGLSSISIGGTITGGTDTQVLYVHPDATIAQNAAFTFTDATGTLSSTIVNATTQFNLGSNFFGIEDSSSLALGTNFLGTASMVNIGLSLKTSQSNQQNGVVIGNGAGINATGSSSLRFVLIGQGTTASAIGFSDFIALGQGNTIGATKSIAIGTGLTTTASGQALFGGSSMNLTDIYWGKGITNATPSATVTMQPTGGLGTDIAGSSYILAGGKGTSAGTPGSVILSTSTALASGTTLQTLTERMRIDGATGSTRWNQAPTAIANYGLLSIGNGAFDGTTSGFFTGSSNGTFLAINAASGATADFANFQVAGAKRFRVDTAGKVYTGGFLYGGEATTDTLTLGSNSSGTPTKISIGLNSATPILILGTGNVKIGTSDATTSSFSFIVANQNGFVQSFGIQNSANAATMVVSDLGQFTYNAANVSNTQLYMYSFNGTNGTNSQNSVITPYKFSGTINANFTSGDEADFFHFIPTFVNTSRTNVVVKLLNIVPTFTNYNTTGATAYGLYMDLGTNPTNAWGLYINQATTKNYLAGSLYLGATTAVGSEIFRVNGQSYYDGALALKDKITTYNNIATAGNGVPAIYGYGRLTAQTAAAASVATYTVSGSDGSFEVSANVNVTASTTHSFTVTCTYTDETNTSQTLTLNFSQVSGTIGTAITNVTGTGAYEGVPVHIRAKASTSITIATTGTFTSVTYNVEGVIKKTA